jgi:hypothetical protein
MDSFIHIKPIKTDEAPPEAEVGLLSTFLTVAKRNWWQLLVGQSGKHMSLEVVSVNQQTQFQMTVPTSAESYFTSQLLSHHPHLYVAHSSTDLVEPPLAFPAVAVANLNLMMGGTLPLKTSTKQEDTPLFGGVLGYMAKVAVGESAAIQFVIRTTNQRYWTNRVRSQMQSTDSEGKVTTSPFKALMDQKIVAPLVEVQARLIYGAQTMETARAKLQELAGAFGIYSQAEGNGLVAKKARGERWLQRFTARQFDWRQPTLILNLNEVASLWHVPGKSLAQIGSIDWGRTLVSEAPNALPVAETMTDEQKQHVNFFAKTAWHNHEAIMGIQREDRTRHTYIIGKTGAGKSTLIANMAINDIRNGEGVAIIDPHGDLSEMILEYVPKRRMNDVIYLDPTLSDDRAFSLNLFDVDGSAHTDVVASGIVSVFYKLYSYSWGPRLEYILRNTILTLLYTGEATFADIPRLLTNQNFRHAVVDRIGDRDPVLREFWLNEFEKMNEKLRTDAIAPVLNKVGQFLSSQRIRHIVGTQRSTLSLEEVMSQGKILILNLSQGKLGEDTTALLGAMFITKIQLAAMKRVSLPNEQRKDFYLYVDEFQNFATGSFTKILSEARKYRLDLILANQYIGQVAEEVQRAIFGNVGTLATFVVGAGDAAALAKELGGTYTEEDLVNLGKYEILIKMAINGLTSTPFAATTLPLPSVVNGNRDKIIRLSLEKYYRKVV